MANRLPTNMSLNIHIINDIAAELGVSAAFVEKDWHAVQVLKTIAEHRSEQIETLFAGGTSLSKGYGLIQRFSEDLDFRCRYLYEGSNNQKKTIRRTYRTSIVNSVQSLDNVSLDTSKIAIASNYIKFPLGYHHQSEAHASLRPHLEVEFSFTQPRLTPQLKPIQSLIAEFTDSPPETEILCLSPIETGSDKLSALTWRVLKRDRSNPFDDPTIIRHLHDLCALTPLIEQDKSLFIKTTQTAFGEDQATGNRRTKMAIYPSFTSALAVLHKDTVYRLEYQQFVAAMSYADDDDVINFDQALASLETLISLFR